MRGTRVKALRQSFFDTYGFLPPKTRRVNMVEKPRNWFVKVWWKITRRQPREWVEIMPSMWRRWKNLAKDADHS